MAALPYLVIGVFDELYREHEDEVNKIMEIHYGLVNEIIDSHRFRI